MSTVKKYAIAMLKSSSGWQAAATTFHLIGHAPATYVTDDVLRRRLTAVCESSYLARWRYVVTDGSIRCCTWLLALSSDVGKTHSKHACPCFQFMYVSQEEVDVAHTFIRLFSVESNVRDS